MNEVVKSNPFGKAISLSGMEALKDALANSAGNDPRGGAGDGSSFMNFSGKRGVYEIGQDKRTCVDEPFLVNVGGFEDGWICWKSGAPKAKRMYPLGVAVQEPDRNEFGPFDKDGDGWYQAKSLVARSIENGEQVYFTINSISGVSAMASLQRSVTERMRAGLPYWPVVVFASEGFTAKGYKNYKPVMEIDGWLSDAQVAEELPALLDGDGEIDLGALYEAAGATGSIGSSEPEPEPEPAQTAKRRRRV
jgi:hypothetical protein